MPYKDKEIRSTKCKEYRRKLGELYRARSRKRDAERYGKRCPNGSWLANQNSPFRHGIWNRNDGYYIT